MTQDIKNSNHFIADNGKVFQRIHNGFSTIADPYIVGDELLLGKILIDGDGNALATPIDDDIRYYQEVDTPKMEERKAKKETVTE